MKKTLGSLLLVASIAIGIYAQSHLRPDKLTAPLLCYLASVVVFVAGIETVSRVGPATPFPLGRIRLPLSRANGLQNTLSPIVRGALPITRLAAVIFFVAVGIVLSVIMWFRVGKGVGDTWSFLLWLGSMGITLACTLFLDRGNRQNRETRVTLKKWLLLLAILSFGGIVRFYNLEGIPHGVHGDETMLGMSAIDVLNGRLTNVFAFGEFVQPSLYYYIQALFVKLFGVSMKGIRFSSAVFGTIGLAALFALAREMFSTRLALLATFLASVAGVAIHFSRLALNNIHSSTFLLLALFFFARGTRTRRMSLFLLSGISAGLGQYFYTGGKIIPLLLAVFGITWFLFIDTHYRRKSACIVWIGIGFLLAIAPMASTYNQHRDLLKTRSEAYIFSSTTWAKGVTQRLAQGDSHAAIIWDQSKIAFLAFNVYGDTSGQYAYHAPMLEFWTSILFVLGIGLSLFRWRDFRYFILLITFGLAVFIGIALTENSPFYPRFVPIIPLISIFPAIAMDGIWSAAVRIPRSRVLIIAVLITLLSLLGYKNLDRYFNVYLSDPQSQGFLEPATDIGYRIRSLPQDVPVYIPGVPIHYRGIVRFAGHRTGIVDYMPIDKMFPTLPRVLGKAVFVFVPGQEEAMKRIMERYRGGHVEMLVHRSIKVYFYLIGTNLP